MKLVEMVKQSPGATGVGAIAGAIATIAVAFITPLMTGHNFERNLAIEAMKGAKTAEDVKARLDLLCSRHLIGHDSNGKRCPAK